MHRLQIRAGEAGTAHRLSSDLILGIESSCDEMAAAVVCGGAEILSSVVQGQVEIHEPYGGVVPELASRDHVRSVSAVVEAALARAQIRSDALGAVAVTAGPGLIGSLLVGLSFGKALAYRCGVPFVGVHHLVGHLASAELADASLRAPYVGLLVSGGHTALYRIEADAPPRLLGETRDDAVGESFDKVAKLLGLGFPGGSALAAAALSGDPQAIRFPRPLLDREGLDFSFSGLKTAVALEVARRSSGGALGDARSGRVDDAGIARGARGGALAGSDVADVAASFEAAAIDVLASRARQAVREQRVSRLAVVGGVAANRRLREALRAAAVADGFEAFFPPPALCTDNAAMIAAAGARLLARGDRAGLELNAFSRGGAPL